MGKQGARRGRRPTAHAREFGTLTIKEWRRTRDLLRSGAEALSDDQQKLLRQLRWSRY
ncbi:MAG: hypothetical protein LC792_16290 [Actinobacteria bacterium]|nr:hypothetical protein [Actinomycetota bacterium]